MAEALDYYYQHNEFNGLIVGEYFIFQFEYLFGSSKNVWMKQNYPDQVFNDLLKE